MFLVFLKSYRFKIKWICRKFSAFSHIITSIPFKEKRYDLLLTLSPLLTEHEEIGQLIKVNKPPPKRSITLRRTVS